MPENSLQYLYDKGGETANSSESEILKIIRDLKDDAKAARDRYLPTSQMNTYLKGYSGEHYPNIEFSPFTKWKSRLSINYLGEVIDFITSFLLEQAPKPVPIPPNEDQESLTEVIEKVMDEIWVNNDMDSVRMEQYVKTALIMGLSVCKIWFDPTLNNGDGEIVFDLVDPRDIYVDPHCQGNVKKARYIIWEKFMPYEEVVRRFPGFRKVIEANITSDTSKESREETTPQSTFFNIAGTKTWDFSMASPMKDTSTRSSDGFLSVASSPSKIKVTEAWLRDYTQVEEMIEGKRIRKAKYTNNIRLVTVIGNKVVQDSSTPYVVLPDFPYVFFIDKPIPFESIGLGTASQVWGLQLDIDQKKSYISDFMKFAGNPVWVVDKESGIKKDSLSNIPGLIITKNQNTVVQRQDPPSIPGGFFESEERSIEQLKEISGARDVMVGKKSRGVRSADQQSDLRESAVGKLKLKLFALKKSVALMGEIEMALLQQYYTSTRVVRIIGDYAKSLYLKFSSVMLEGIWKIKAESMPSTPATKQARFDQAIRLYSMGIVGKKEVLDVMEFPNRDKILKRSEEANQAYYKALTERVVPKGKKPPKI